MADRIDTLEDILGFFCDNPIDEMIERNLVTDESLQNFFKFVIYAEKYDLMIDDLIYNGGNLGIQNNEIKILDWGSKEFISSLYHTASPIEYDSLQKRINLYAR